MKLSKKFYLIIFIMLSIIVGCDSKKDSAWYDHNIEMCERLLASSSTEIVKVERNHNLPPDFENYSYYLKDNTILEGKPLFYIKIKDAIGMNSTFLYLDEIKIKNNFFQDSKWISLKNEERIRFGKLINAKQK